MMRLILALLLFAGPVQATVYTVKTAGGGDYTTIQDCAKVAVAGDTCTIYTGTYAERVTPANSGTSGNLITFNASGTVVVTNGFDLSNLDYIKIDGLTIQTTSASTDGILLSSSDGFQILNNIIQDVSRNGIRQFSSVPGNSGIIRFNTIRRCGVGTSAAPAGIVLAGNSHLVEFNDISHVGDGIIPFGTSQVIRNNVVHDCDPADYPGGTMHCDAVQVYCSNAIVLATSLIENNLMYDVTDSNSHFADIEGGSTCTEGNLIIRHNRLRNVGTYAWLIGASLEANAYTRSYLYQNTITSTAAKDTTAYAVSWTGYSTYGRWMNNILHDACKITACMGYNVGSTAATGFVGDYSLGYKAAGGTWTTPITSETNEILNSDPLFTSSTDLTLQATSPALNAGGSLTTVATADGGSGTTLILNDAGFFAPGWAGTNGDWIAVGTVGNVAQVASVDYSTNTITLAAGITRNDDDPVWLYKNSNGTIALIGAAPDIGAYERMATAKTDAFTGTGTLDTGWNPINTAALSVTRQTNVAGPSTSGYPGAYWIGDTPSNNQYAQVTLSVVASAAYDMNWVVVRYSHVGGYQNFYLLGVQSNYWEVAKMVNDSYTTLSSGSLAFAATDTIKLAVDGTVLKAFKNGTQIGGNITDSAVTSGYFGFGFDAGGTTNCRSDAFEGGNYTAGGSPPAVKAFPTAEGFGKDSVGGRGGNICKVTSLNDSGAGTLRNCLQNVSGPRIVTFAVSGTIALTSAISLSGAQGSFITIAGQTSPGGVQLKGGGTTALGFYQGAHDIIVRHLRIRPGNIANGGGTSDYAQAITINGSYGESNNPIYNSIFDHLSIEWAGDDPTAMAGSLPSHTLQWSLIARGHIESADPGSKGISIGDDWEHVDNISVHHNLSAHQSMRMPGPMNAALLDLRNNYFYNWGSANPYGDPPWSGSLGVGWGNNAEPGAYTQGNVVKNVWKAGLNTTPTTFIGRLAGHFMGEPTYLYLEDNRSPNYPSSAPANEWSHGFREGWYDPAYGQPGATYYEDAAVEADFRVYTAYSAPAITETAVDSLLTALAATVGAYKPSRDSLDQGIIDETVAGTGYIATSGGGGPWPDLATGAPSPPIDTDGDAMPDTWETLHNLNPNDAGDGPAYASNGYTNVENYLNELAGDEIWTGAVGPVISLVASSGVTESGATITWTTDVASDSQVEWGLTTAYGSSNTLDPTYVTSHSMTITGLAAGTLYHYRVRSSNGILTLGSDNNLTTLEGQPPEPGSSRMKMRIRP